MAARAEVPSPSNSPELTITELSGALKRTIEDRFGFVRVRGEVSGWRGPHSSGHCYFSLKDEGARIDAVIWKGVYGRLKIRPEEGMEVIATGKITTWPGKSAYQIVVESIEPAGVGALLAQLEERRKRLAAEGLFDEARKQLLPFIPKVIGVVTSPTGAVIRDILHRLADRFPARVLIWPVRVQGETSGAEVARAINGLNALPEGGAIPRPDVIIVARGGGSLEDLWGFNDEIVVRAAAESMIPLVSAVGHETDWTLIDHAADRRAPTPTAAAEICVPVRAELLAQVATCGGRLAGARSRMMQRHRTDLRALARALPGPEDLLAMPRQRLDRAGEILPARIRRTLSDRHVQLGRLASKLADHSPQTELARRRVRFDSFSERHAALGKPGVLTERRALQLRVLDDRLRKGLANSLQKTQQRIEHQQHRIDDLGKRIASATRLAIPRRREQLRVLDDRLRKALGNSLQKTQQRIEHQQHRIDDLGKRIANATRLAIPRRRDQLRALSQLLSSLGYRNVLARGFALVRDASGAPVRSAVTVAAGDRLAIEFADGQVQVSADGGAPGERSIETPKPAAPRPARAAPIKKDQGSLF
jgi:exodeoxyribonuclease VII large subunit